STKEREIILVMIDLRDNIQPIDFIPSFIENGRRARGPSSRSEIANGIAACATVDGESKSRVRLRFVFRMCKSHDPDLSQINRAKTKTKRSGKRRARDRPTVTMLS